MRYMGIDYGSKRVGIALTDESGTMAFPHTVLETTAQLVSQISELIEKHGVGKVVIGHSLDRQSNPNTIQAAIEALLTDLTLACGVPVHLQPEQYTTQAALRIQGRTNQTDASAAALILDSFLQHVSNTNQT